MKAPLYTAGKLPQLPYICTSCYLRLQQTRGTAFVSKTTKLARITTRNKWRWKYGDKLKEAEEEWQEKAKEIAEGKQDGMLSILEQRGFVNQIAGYSSSIVLLEFILMISSVTANTSLH